LLFQDVISRWPMILNGVVLTLVLSFVAIGLGIVLATLMTALRSLAGAWAGYIVDAYVELMRNTPFLVQLFMIFFGLPQIGIRMNGLEASALAMTLNLAAYSTEIIRAGVDSIHKSQIEAGLALAMSKRQVFQYVVLQPAFARVWPALSSQFVLMMLASSICSFVSVQELSGTAAIIEADTFRSFETYIIVTVIYLVLALSLKLVLNWLGRRIFPQVSGLARLDAKAEAA
jgi:polar amino acid transport system permease protein